ncbi:MAG: methyltransferase, partial [Rhodospirillaceae bacterium]|nr:methyltransferase [Rhodospirillaceae bacterium]
VRQAHNDYTEISGPQRVRDLVDDPAEAERLAEGRFAVINVWRPIRGPLLRAPLAVADARSVAEGDLQAADLVYPDRVGEIYELAYGSQHGWYYVPAMTADEALLIKSYDSARDGRARFTPHSAFDDPTMPEDAPPRESIEVRVLAFFEE